jgi:hypothetical protein
MFLLACQGALKLNDPGEVRDMATAPDLAGEPTPGFISFADINRDLDRFEYGCTNGFSSCHGGATPTGLMSLEKNANQDMTTLMANYSAVLTRVNTTMPDQSLILQKMLKTSTVAHSGLKPFDTISDPIYQRWLLWIQKGAKFESVATTASITGGN